MSVASEAFAWSLEELSSWQPDDPASRPAFDVWREPLFADQPDASATDATGHTNSGGAATQPVVGNETAGVSGGIATASADLRTGKISCLDLVEDALAAIERNNERLNAFVEVLSDSARAEARERDAELRAGKSRGPLHGIPISVKDVIHVGGVTTRAGSDAYSHTPEHDAWAVARLREAGAVILGKTATHEFALGVTSPQSRNPHDDKRIPGGSSGGSGVAVATGMGLASVGTDTRASSRVPAALCGVVGFKPTYGTIPTDGVVPLSWTMDHVGVLAPGVADAESLMSQLQQRPTHATTQTTGLKVGLPAAAWEDCDPLVTAAVSKSLDSLSDAGADVFAVDNPSAADFRGANAMGMLVSRCEAATFHRGLGSDRSLYWDEVRDQLDAADHVLATDYIDAQRYRTDLHARMLGAVTDVDIFAMPASPVFAPLVEEAEDYLTVLSRNAILWSFVGFPAISVPCPVPTGSLPAGIQLVAAPHCEHLLIGAGRIIEQARHS